MQVQKTLQDRPNATGIDPENSSFYSLPARLAASAIKDGAPTYKVSTPTGHASDVMQARDVWDAGLFDGTVAGALL